MSRAFSLSQNIGPIMGALRSVPVPPRHLEETPPQAPKPFITVSRQPGAAGITLAQKFLDAINRTDDGQDPPWTCWDRELVEKVAADKHLSQRLIDSMETTSHTWLETFLAGLTGEPDELMVFSRVAQTIRALAQVGHVVIVGRGGVFITRNMPGGLHVRLVAPLQKRIKHIAATMGMSAKDAAQWIAQQEANRAAFYRRHWPGETLDPERFALVINTAEIKPTALVQMLVSLVHNYRSAHAGK